MVDPKKVSLEALPKKFVDGALGAHNEEIFTFAFTSGNELTPFAATPRTMKSIAVWLTGQVAMYEKKYGAIDISPHQIASPIQRSDLDGKDGGQG
jgi:hypothetical protein